MRFIVFLITFLIPLNLMAADYSYAPDGCAFQLTLPGEPLTLRRCHPDLPEQCDLRTTYTQVFGLDTTLNVYVKCEDTDTTNYNADMMRTTLIAHAGSHIESYQTDAAKEENDTTTVMLLGSGKSRHNNNKTMLYTSQIRTHGNSILLIEGEIIGEAHEKADKMLADVLHSISTTVE